MKTQDARRWKGAKQARRAVVLAAVLAAPAVSAGLILEFGDPANPFVPVSNFNLQPGEVKSIQLLVNNDAVGIARLSGYTLELGIAGGGPILGGTAGPGFTQVDLVTGTPFAADHGSPVVLGGPNPFPGVGSVPQYLGLSLNTAGTAQAPETLAAVSFAPGRSLVGTVTISAVGFTTPQSWSMEFVGAGVSTFFNDAYNAVITPGMTGATLTLVPEVAPAGVAAGLLAGFVVLRWMRRRA